MNFFVHAVDRKPKRNAKYPTILCEALTASFWLTRRCTDLLADDSSALHVLAELGYRIALRRQAKGHTLSKLDSSLQARIPMKILAKQPPNTPVTFILPKNFLTDPSDGHAHAHSDDAGPAHSPRKSPKKPSATAAHKPKKARKAKEKSSESSPTRVNAGRAAKVAVTSFREDSDMSEDEVDEDSDLPTGESPVASRAKASAVWHPVTAKASSTPIGGSTPVVGGAKSNKLRLREVTNQDLSTSRGRKRKSDEGLEAKEAESDEDDEEEDELSPMVIEQPSPASSNASSASSVSSAASSEVAPVAIAKAVAVKMKTPVRRGGRRSARSTR
jgi:hypothetical protein